MGAGVTVPTRDKIAAVDRLIHDLRWLRDLPNHPQYVEYQALKEIHADLVAETPKEITKVLGAIAFQVESARKSKARIGIIEIGNMQTLAEGMMGRWWPVVKKALERFEEASDETSHS